MKKRSRILVALLAVGLLAGCAGRGGDNSFDNPKSSSIYVTDEGTFSTATVETYEKQDYYNEEEWKGQWTSFLEQAAADYNSEHGEGAVTLKSGSLEDGTITMIYDYATGDDLVQFTSFFEDEANQVGAISSISVEEALNQAGTDGILFVRLSDGKTASTDEIAKKSDYHVVVVEGLPGQTRKIKTEGKIAFVSSNVSITNSYAVEIGEGKSYIIFK